MPFPEKQRNIFREEFKRTLVELHVGGKSQNALCKEYGVSKSALSKWVKQYSTVETEDGDILTAWQVKELQMRNAQLEEENLILKKRLPYSRHTPAEIKCCVPSPLPA